MQHVWEKQRQNSSVLYSDPHRDNPTESQAPLKEDAPNYHVTRAWRNWRPHICSRKADLLMIAPPKSHRNPQKPVCNPHVAAHFPAFVCRVFGPTDTFITEPTQWWSCWLCYQAQIREVREGFKPGDSINSLPVLVLIALIIATFLSKERQTAKSASHGSEISTEVLRQRSDLPVKVWFKGTRLRQDLGIPTMICFWCWRHIFSVSVVCALCFWMCG